jgi:hypothetical protein
VSGYWHANYWHANYWHANYWASSATPPADGEEALRVTFRSVSRTSFDFASRSDTSFEFPSRSQLG